MGKGGIIGKSNNPSANSASGMWSLREQYSAIKNSVWPKEIVTNGLVLNLDAGNNLSYPGSGTTWTDLSGSSYNFTVQSGSWVNNGPASYFNFSGPYSCAKRVVSGALSNVPSSANNTLMVFSNILNSTATFRTLIRGAAEDHQVLVNISANTIGYYNNLGGTPTGVFVNSTYSVNSITNYTTTFNCLHWKFAQSSPFWTFGWNNNFNVASLTANNAINDYGFAAIGGLQNGVDVISSANASQFWGNTAVVLYYNRTLTDAEITQNFNAYRGRFGI